MSCAYCFERFDDQRNSCSKADLNETIAYLKRYIDYENVFLVFHGGEPLLSDKKYIDTVLNFVINNFKGNYKIQIQTNGTLLDDKWIQILEKYSHVLSLSISMDPARELDLRRMPSEDYRRKVWNNIQTVLSIFDNVGIVSVMHRYNKDHYIEFIYSLSDFGIKNLTISKYRNTTRDLTLDDISVSECEYSDQLIKILTHYIKDKLYKKIKIQPLNSLLSRNNKLCIYLNKQDKCFEFSTFSPGKIIEHCYHLENHLISLAEQCKCCEILNFCGGGCPCNPINEDFCIGRKKLYNFIGELKHADTRFAI